MLFNNNTNGDPRSFMYYNGEYYIDGTEIIVSDEYINSNTFDGRKLWKYARFHSQTKYNGKNAYYFCATKLDVTSLRSMGIDLEARKQYAHYFIVEALDIQKAIGEITKPIKLSQREHERIDKHISDMIEHPKKDWDYSELRVAWIIYIALMAASLIFNQFYILWIIITYFFFKWRKDIIDK